MELFLRNEAGGLADDGAKRSGVEFPMFWNGESLTTGRSGPKKLDMASALGMYGKTEVREDPNDFVAGEPFQLRHEAVRAPS